MREGEKAGEEGGRKERKREGGRKRGRSEKERERERRRERGEGGEGGKEPDRRNSAITQQINFTALVFWYGQFLSLVKGTYSGTIFLTVSQFLVSRK